MPALLPPLQLTGAQTLRNVGLSDQPVALAEGKISEHFERSVDLSGYLVLPGIVDMMACPPQSGSADIDAQGVLHEAAVRGACQGVTTQYLSHAWRPPETDGAPSASHVMVEAWQEARPTLMTDVRVLLEIDHGLATEHRQIMDLIASTGIDLVAFSNGAQRADHVPRTLNSRTNARRPNVTMLLDHPSHVHRSLLTLVGLFDGLGVTYGSTGDTSAETREHHSMLGASLCIAPRSTKAAAAARAVNDPVVLSASDIVEQLRTGTLGKSNPIGADALVSDNDIGALARVALALTNAGVLDLGRAWALISENPARLLGLSDRGSLTPGQRADLTVVNQETDTVEATICAGRLSYLTGQAGSRFMDVPVSRAVAAE
ncbi:MAG: amidohydrolase family protein [Pseudomonadota bacterium]